MKFLTGFDKIANRAVKALKAVQLPLTAAASGHYIYSHIKKKLNKDVKLPSNSVQSEAETPHYFV